MVRYPNIMKLVNTTALWGALDAQRATSDTSWRDIGRQLGLSASTFVRMRHGHGIDLYAYAACCHWLGVSLDTFTARVALTTFSPELELALLLRQIGVPETYWRSLVDLITQLAGAKRETT